MVYTNATVQNTTARVIATAIRNDRHFEKDELTELFLRIMEENDDNLNRTILTNMLVQGHPERRVEKVWHKAQSNLRP